ncbi:hypothetical protein GPECTOR_46g210 [Gonium pectorale]|uniref:Uncharacterized protein n=1 Tax=Gonium pectorale TaxID=33097 RepID=A0A150G8K3_GONPE|nr:hypothetical protein GPECTOR_46g210 [Gonium pectorale]|eukprot:KXZ46141.1 hypothetical protein GPECTOR_46g210 [Gonium pectorale]
MEPEELVAPSAGSPLVSGNAASAMDSQEAEPGGEPEGDGGEGPPPTPLCSAPDSPVLAAAGSGPPRPRPARSRDSGPGPPPPLFTGPREPLHPLWQASPRRGMLAGGSVRGWVPVHLLGPSASVSAGSSLSDAADGSGGPLIPLGGSSACASPASASASNPLLGGPAFHQFGAPYPLLLAAGAGLGPGAAGACSPSSRASSTHSDRPLRVGSGPAALVTPSHSFASLQVSALGPASGGSASPGQQTHGSDRDQEDVLAMASATAAGPPGMPVQQQQQQQLGPITGPLRGSRMQGHVTAVANPAYVAAAAAATATAAAAIAAAIDSAAPGACQATLPLREVSRRQRLLQSVAALAPAELDAPAPSHALLPGSAGSATAALSTDAYTVSSRLGTAVGVRPTVSVLRDGPAAVAAAAASPIQRAGPPPLAATVAAAVAAAANGPVEGLQGHSISAAAGPSMGGCSSAVSACLPASSPSQLLAVVDPHTLAHVQAQAAAVAAAAGLGAAAGIPLPLGAPSASPWGAGGVDACPGPAAALGQQPLQPQPPGTASPALPPNGHGPHHGPHRPGPCKGAHAQSSKAQPHIPSGAGGYHDPHQQNHHYPHHGRGPRGRQRRPSLTEFGNARAALQHRPTDAWAQHGLGAGPGDTPGGGARGRGGGAEEFDVQVVGLREGAGWGGSVAGGGGGGAGPPLHAFQQLRHSQHELHLGPATSVVVAVGGLASSPRRLHHMGPVLPAGSGVSGGVSGAVSGGVSGTVSGAGGGSGLASAASSNGGAAARPVSSLGRSGSSSGTAGAGGGGASTSTSWLSSGVSLLQALASGGDTSPHAGAYRPSRGSMGGPGAAGGLGMGPGGGAPFLSMGPGRLHHPHQQPAQQPQQRPVRRGGRVH